VPSFKAIELVEGRRTGREFLFEVDTRQAAIGALVHALGVVPEAAHADPAKTLVQIADARWSIVATRQPTVVPESGALRRGGAKHKQVR
jgi:hypothetical protein